MGFVEDELQEIKAMVEKHITGSKLEACIPAMVRVNIRRTKFKQLIVCLQFPKNYPAANILVELKSRHISQKLLDGLANLSEKEAKKILGKPQILHVLKFVRNFIDENPLCCCSEEISELKQKIARPSDEIKLKQKTSSILVITMEGEYSCKYNITVPEDYPDTRDVPSSEDDPLSVERVYCGHFYHHACLDTYIKTPPFAGGKTCHSCSLKIYHDKWKLSPALVEARWAHKQARQRELDEAIDFFA
ncbi:hypothetical protein HAZT_HAZT008718 [Hyalella azteca]|uniref:RWD domain-containing protein n=1 Tax=Hyalella azteca TaxID=294128 RepID=A0A6A0H5P7_HYAAZ|nr:hypothetical protein HAZT_HAZT008718 [Hyalella azteca]